MKIQKIMEKYGYRLDEKLSKKKMEQMVREIAGFMAESGADFSEVLGDYAGGMKSSEIDKIEDLYYDMLNKGKLKGIKGVQ